MSFVTVSYPGDIISSQMPVWILSLIGKNALRVISVPPQTFPFHSFIIVCVSPPPSRHVIYFFWNLSVGTEKISYYQSDHGLIENACWWESNPLIRVCRLSNGDVYCSGYAVRRDREEPMTLCRWENSLVGYGPITISRPKQDKCRTCVVCVFGCN